MFGQEPDEFKGGYIKEQVFQGKISQFNWWDSALNASIIAAMANCQNGDFKGNIVSWSKENFQLEGGLVFREANSQEFCSKEEKWLFFPGRRTRRDAERLCGAHGGWVVVPKNQEENQKVLDMYKENEETCKMPDSDLDMVGWVGTVLVNGSVFVSQFDKLIFNASFTNVIKR